MQVDIDPRKRSTSSRDQRVKLFGVGFFFSCSLEQRQKKSSVFQAWVTTYSTQTNCGAALAVHLATRHVATMNLLLSVIIWIVVVLVVKNWIWSEKRQQLGRVFLMKNLLWFAMVVVVPRLIYASITFLLLLYQSKD
jgi:hypothetical protein